MIAASLWLGKPWRYGLAAVIGVAELAMLAIAFNPTVGPTYRARYIDGTSDCWLQPVSGEYALGTKLDASVTGDAAALRRLLRCGWFDPGANGTWSQGGETELRFRLDGPREALALELDLAPFGIAFGLEQRVVVSAGGIELGSFTLATEPPSPHVIPIPATTPLTADGYLDIALALPDAVAPKSLGINQEPRRLAVRLISLRLAPAP